MVILINYKSGLPVYLQITAQIKAAAASGVLCPGELLPSVRALAEELRINRNTVAKAYADLESDGVVELRPGSGCFLSQTNASPLRLNIRSQRLAESVDHTIVQAHHLQISDNHLRELVEERLQKFHENQLRHKAASRDIY